MNKIKQWLQNRDVIMVLALCLGLLWGEGARWTQGLTLPALAFVMTLSTMGVTGGAFRPPRALLVPALAGIAMNYFLLGSVLLLLGQFLIGDPALRSGFVIIAAVPPAVAVIPFTFFLQGDSTFTFVGTVGAYLGALILTPLIALWFLGGDFISPGKLFMIMVQLILIPWVASRVLIRAGLASRIEPIKGKLTNWSFFLLTYIIVGVNREVFLMQPLSLAPVAVIAVASTFLLGWGIEKAGNFFRVPHGKVVSLVLLGTLKNYGLAGGLSLALFSNQTAVPATVSSVFMIIYIIWLQFKKRKT